MIKIAILLLLLLSVAVSEECITTEQIIVDETVNLLPFDLNGEQLEEVSIKLNEAWDAPITLYNFNQYDLALLLRINIQTQKDSWCNSYAYTLNTKKEFNLTVPAEGSYEVDIVPTYGKNHPYCKRYRYTNDYELTYLTTSDVTVKPVKIPVYEDVCVTLEENTTSTNILTTENPTKEDSGTLILLAGILGALAIIIIFSHRLLGFFKSILDWMLNYDKLQGEPFPCAEINGRLAYYKKGYVYFYNDGDPEPFSKNLVHRHIARNEIYYPNKKLFEKKFEYYDVHHIDRNSLNLKKENLAILTRAQHNQIKNWKIPKGDRKAGIKQLKAIKPKLNAPYIPELK